MSRCYPAAHVDCGEKSVAVPCPCEITSIRRALHSAWTEEPSDGEPAFPRTANLSRSLSGVLLRHAELVRYCRDRASDDLVELRNRVGFAASRTQRVVGSKTYDAAVHSSAVAIDVPPEQPSAVNLKFPSYRRESS